MKEKLPISDKNIYFFIHFKHTDAFFSIINGVIGDITNIKDISGNITDIVNDQESEEYFNTEFYYLYNSILDITKPVITLNGDSVVNIEVKGVYNEQGAIAIDNYDGDITNNIIITGTVDTNIVGTYLIRYKVSDRSENTTEVIRTVNIVDTTIPVITLNGESIINIQVGNQYIEQGAAALDNYDGDISNNVIISGTVDVNTFKRKYLLYYL